MPTLNDNPTESEIVSNSTDEHLYSNKSKKGNGYFNYQVPIPEKEISISPKVKLRVTVYYVSQKNDIRSIILGKWKKNNGERKKDCEIKFSKFGFNELKKILNFFNENDLGSINDRKLKLENATSLENITNKEQTELVELIKEFLESRGKDTDILKELLDNEEVSSHDIVGLGYRKQQLEIFNKLLSKEGYIDDYKERNNFKQKGKEIAWQHFFENNQWIFGYGLNYIWKSSSVENKLEQVVSGSDFNSSGKRSDGLLTTLSNINRFALVEIKTSNKNLIGANYRPDDCRTPGKHLRGGIVQLQKTIHKFKKEYYESTNLEDPSGYDKGEVFNISPKAYLIIGNLDEFKNDDGKIHREKYSSFELFRNSINGIEIITFDELYNRAKSIVDHFDKN